MKAAFLDWAKQEIEYEIHQEFLHEDSNELVYVCYVREREDNEWERMSYGHTPEKAIKNAIDEWNYLDTVGRG